MKPRDDSIECPTCDNELFVPDAGPDRDTPCPDCNQGLVRGGPDYDRHEVVATNTALTADAGKTTH